MAVDTKYISHHRNQNVKIMISHDITVLEFQQILLVSNLEKY